MSEEDRPLWDEEHECLINTFGQAGYIFGYCAAMFDVDPTISQTNDLAYLLIQKLGIPGMCGCMQYALQKEFYNAMRDKQEIKELEEQIHDE